MVPPAPEPGAIWRQYWRPRGRCQLEVVGLRLRGVGARETRGVGARLADQKRSRRQGASASWPERRAGLRYDGSVTTIAAGVRHAPRPAAAVAFDERRQAAQAAHLAGARLDLDRSGSPDPRPPREVVDLGAAGALAPMPVEQLRPFVWAGQRCASSSCPTNCSATAPSLIRMGSPAQIARSPRTGILHETDVGHHDKLEVAESAIRSQGQSGSGGRADAVHDPRPLQQLHRHTSRAAVRVDRIHELASDQARRCRNTRSRWSGGPRVLAEVVAKGLGDGGRPGWPRHAAALRYSATTAGMPPSSR